MDTSQKIEPSINIPKKVLFISIIISLLTCISPFASASLLKFEFMGSGELYDETFQPLDNFKKVDMSLNFILGSSELALIKSTVGSQLNEFVFTTTLSNIDLTVDNQAYSKAASAASFSGIAINSDLDFWENSFQIDLDGKSFSANQWIRNGTVSEGDFDNSPDKLNNYYSDMMDSVNGEWAFQLSQNEVFLGAFTHFSITSISVPESNSITLLVIGLLGLIVHKKLIIS